MPNWSVPVLQWGGCALAIVSAAALIYVLGIMEPAAEGEQITAQPFSACMRQKELRSWEPG